MIIPEFVLWSQQTYVCMNTSPPGHKIFLAYIFRYTHTHTMESVLYWQHLLSMKTGLRCSWYTQCHSIKVNRLFSPSVGIKWKYVLVRGQTLGHIPFSMLGFVWFELLHAVTVSLRSVFCSATIRDASSVCRWDKYRDLELKNVQSERPWNSHSWAVCLQQIPLLGNQGALQKRR